MKKLPSSAITAFDVFRPTPNEPLGFKEPPSLILIRQPPSPFPPKPVEGVTMFLNTTEEGTWYALSTQRYPLLSLQVQPAPWVISSQRSRNRNMTKEDLVGVHPIIRPPPMSADDPQLPASSTLKLIEGGDWQKVHRDHLVLRRRFLIGLLVIVFIVVFWRRRRRNAKSKKNEPEMPAKTVLKDETIVAAENKADRVENGSIDVHLEDHHPVEANDHGQTVEKKPRRKRGQRGGKNNKKKVGFEPAAEVEDDQKDDHETEPAPKDLVVGSQGNHTVDGLTVTDKLLGSLHLFRF